VKDKPLLNPVSYFRVAVWKVLSGWLLGCIPLGIVVVLVWLLSENMLSQYPHSLFDIVELTAERYAFVVAAVC
jgi:hypothetical protein